MEEPLRLGTPYLILQDGSGNARLLLANEVLAMDPEAMLDSLPGGMEVGIVEGTTTLDALPTRRPLVVQDNGVILGLYGAAESEAAQKARKARRWSQADGHADARAAANDAIKEIKDYYRRRGVSLMLSLQPCRVSGDGIIVRDVMAGLLEYSLEMIELCGGGRGVYVDTQQGIKQVKITVEARTRSSFEDIDLMLSDEHTENLLIRKFRALRRSVAEHRGDLQIEDTPRGFVFTATLPA